MVHRCKKANEFHNYLSDGPLFIIVEKGTKNKYQLHFSSDKENVNDDSYMDAKDKPISIKFLVDKFPILEKLFHKYLKNNLYFINYADLTTDEFEKLLDNLDFEYGSDLISYIINTMLNIKKLNFVGIALAYMESARDTQVFIKRLSKSLSKSEYEEVIINMVKCNTDTFDYIQNPSEVVQLTVIDADPGKIAYIENPSENVQLVAITHVPYLIRSIKNPTEAVQKLAISKNPKLYYSINKTARIKGMLSYARSIETQMLKKKKQSK